MPIPLISTMIWITERFNEYLKIAYLGLDRNRYPGNTNLKQLRKTFRYSSYWLSPPPGETESNWLGHYKDVQSADLGFLVLYAATDVEDPTFTGNSYEQGKADAETAKNIAINEGFPTGTIIYLDIERGGAMTFDKQLPYLTGWLDQMATSPYKAGVYCSGIPDDEGIITAEFIKNSFSDRDITCWVYDDRCPLVGHLPGCQFPKSAPWPHDWNKESIVNVAVWQYAQSPRRVKECADSKDKGSEDFAKDCSNYFSNEGIKDPLGCYCFPPGFEDGSKLDSDGAKMYVDVNTATSPDPSHGRKYTIKKVSPRVSLALVVFLLGIGYWFYKTSKSF